MATKNNLSSTAPPPEPAASAAWLCANQYYQVLLTYLICNRHFNPGKARKILENFFADQFVKDKFQADSQRAGTCFRILIRETLELYLFEKQYEEHSEKRYPPLDNLPSDPFFDRQWAKETVAEAMRRVKGICSAASEAILFQSLLDDLSSRPYKDRPSTLSLREQYHNSERAKQYLLQQLESLLSSTISDSRLVMQEWQALHQILPEAVALDPEILTQHFLSAQDMSAFWLELQSEIIPGLEQTFAKILFGANTTREDLQQARKIIKLQNPNQSLPLELLEAMLYACLAVELLKFPASLSEIQRRALPRGLFWLSKQHWLDPETHKLAGEAEKNIRQMTAQGYNF